MPVIGFLHAGTEKENGADFEFRAFRQGLSEAGFSEDRNVTILDRWAEEQNNRLPALAADLVRRQVKVIVTTGGKLPVLAAKGAQNSRPRDVSTRPA